jgi:Transposase IS4
VSTILPASGFEVNFNSLSITLACSLSSLVDADGYLHGCNVLYELVRPWANTDAVVVADSYFSSVGAAIRLKTIGLRFIGCMKTATREFPMHYLGSVPLPGGKGS